MTNDRNKRVLDKDFEDGITGRAGEIRRDVEGRMGEYQKGAQESIGKAQKYAYEKNDEVEALIREHPKSYVAGAFAAGALTGLWLGRRRD